MSEDKILRVVLLGKTGCGKSSLGNTLLGKGEVFRVGRGMRSGTEQCQWADADRFGIDLQVTDTPGLCDTHRSEDDVILEVGKSVAVASPGPHIILMVLRCDKRFTEEDYTAYQTLKQMFGPSIQEYMIIVFTGSDALGAKQDEQKEILTQEVSRSSPRLKEVLSDASHRYIGVDNTASGTALEQHAQSVITMMQDLKHSNGGRFYDNPVSQQVNELVEQIVQRNMQAAQSREEAIRITNKEIVEEKVSPGFLESVKTTILASAKLAVIKVGELAGEFARAAIIKACSIM